MQLCVLGLLGRTLSGPWMRQFYTSAEKQINFVQGIRVVREVMEKLKVTADCPNAFWRLMWTFLETRWLLMQP